MQTFEGVKIEGLLISEIKSTRTSLLEKIAGRDYKIKGPYFDSTEPKYEKKTEVIELRKTDVQGETYYALFAGENNLSAGQYDEFGWFSTPEKAKAEASEFKIGQAVSIPYLIDSGHNIDGTGYFLVTYTGGDCDYCSPGYVGDHY